MKGAGGGEYSQVPIFNPISYLSLNSKQQMSDQNLAIAVAVNLQGILIETFHKIQSEYILLRFIDLENETNKIAAKANYCSKMA
jgi:hypothetical protein